MAEAALRQGGGMKVADDLEIRIVSADDLREQDVNAHVVAPRVFERMVENIRERGALESLPYCAQPRGEGPVEILSGHHRVRAARAAGLQEFPVLVDTAPMTRSRMVAKQLAHNALVGTDDPDVLKQLVGFIETPDDLLHTGLPEDMLPTPESDAVNLFLPHADFDWRTISFSALPHQQVDLEELCRRLDGQHDLVLAVLPEQFDAFLTAAAKYSRLRQIRSGGTVVASLTEVALNEVRQAEDEAAQGWVSFSSLLGVSSIPAEAAETVKAAIERMKASGDIGDRNRWQLLELLAADYLAGSDQEVS